LDGYPTIASANANLEVFVCSFMKGRITWSMVVGLVLSLILEITSAVVTVLHPSFADHPELPHPIFLLLLFPGWVMTGGPPFHWWMEAIAVSINGVFYGGVVFCFLSIWKSRRKRCAKSS